MYETIVSAVCLFPDDVDEMPTPGIHVHYPPQYAGTWVTKGRKWECLHPLSSLSLPLPRTINAQAGREPAADFEYIDMGIGDTLFYMGFDTPPPFETPENAKDLLDKCASALSDKAHDNGRPKLAAKLIRSKSKKMRFTLTELEALVEYDFYYGPVFMALYRAYINAVATLAAIELAHLEA